MCVSITLHLSRLRACRSERQVPRVSVEGIKPCTLANTGLLVAVLKCSRGGGGREGGGGDAEAKGEDLGKGEEDVATVNLVVQVTDEGQGGLRRCIYSPLE